MSDTKTLTIFQQEMARLRAFSNTLPILEQTRVDLYSKYLQRGGVGAELGVLWGVNAKSLLDKAKPKRLYLIDPWKSAGSPWNPMKPNRFQSRNDKKFQHVRNLFKRDSRVNVWRVYSFEAVASVEDRSLDWVYIDAYHRYTSVLADIQTWLPKVKKGGIIMCHDFTTLIFNGGVIEAVMYALRRPGGIEVLGKDAERCSTVVIRKVSNE
jgi:hypothetical protein